MKTALTGIAVSLLAATGVAVAQDMRPPRPGAVMRADTNGDGVITRQEVIDQATKRFDRLDTNHDGKLEASELPQPRQRMRGDRPMPPPTGAAQPRQ